MECVLMKGQEEAPWPLRPGRAQQGGTAYEQDEAPHGHQSHGLGLPSLQTEQCIAAVHKPLRLWDFVSSLDGPDTVISSFVPQPLALSKGQWKRQAGWTLPSLLRSGITLDQSLRFSGSDIPRMIAIVPDSQFIVRTKWNDALSLAHAGWLLPY